MKGKANLIVCTMEFIQKSISVEGQYFPVKDISSMWTPHCGVARMIPIQLAVIFRVITIKSVITVKIIKLCALTIVKEVRVVITKVMTVGVVK